MYKIEKNIPITPARSINRNQRKYPFDTMKVGDSFLIEVAGLDKRKRANITSATRASAHNYKIYNKLKEFTVVTRVVKEGIRVWRTK